MAENPLTQLSACGQSVWNDNIQRTFVTNGDLQRLVEQDALGGVTSNPTIFEKAIGGSSDYDDDLKRYVGEGEDAEGVFKRLAVTDITLGADVLRPVYDRTEGQDGYISIEVSPSAAHDTPKTLDDAHYFWDAIGRPNVMIKVPASTEGIPAVEQLISEGINVNITLIFASEVYEQVIDAYLKGLEKRVEQGKPIDRLGSVASFFVSRVDTLVDKLLEEKAKKDNGENAAELKALEGKAAIANAKIAYQIFEREFGSERFKKLAAKGARVQRPLWASTSTKNPNYPDTYYVEALVGRDTVDTMPPATIVAVRDHGKITCDTVTKGVDEAHAVIERLDKVGINMTDVTSQLTTEGIASFTKSLDTLLETIRKKAAEIKAEATPVA